MDDPAAVSTLISSIRDSTVGYLQEQAHRFTRGSALLTRFEHACAAWESGSAPTARQVTDTVNELRVALRLLQDSKCLRLEYEPPLAGTRKTIDFSLINPEGARIFYDVKTVIPDSGDKWNLYQRAKTEGWFAPGSELHLEESFGGGEIAHDKFASREKFIKHSVDLESKIRANGKTGSYCYRMVFCGDHYAWLLGDLEDFVGTYFGRRTAWDHLAVMQTHTMGRFGWTWDRSIDGFCYFERGPRRPEETAFDCDVRGPGLRGSD